MPAPQDQDATVRRFERIEAAHETIAKAMGTLTTESHSAFGNINATQRHVLDLIKQQDFRLTALARSAEALVQVQTMQGQNLQSVIDVMHTLIAAQTRTEERMGELAAAQKRLTDAIAANEAKHAGEHDDLKDKLHVLYEVVDNWIREHGSGARNGAPPPEPPAA